MLVLDTCLSNNISFFFGGRNVCLRIILCEAVNAVADEAHVSTVIASRSPLERLNFRLNWPPPKTKTNGEKLRD